MEVCCKSSKGNGVTTTGNKARSSLPTLLVSVQSWLSVLTNEIRQVRKAGSGGGREGGREEELPVMKTAAMQRWMDCVYRKLEGICKNYNLHFKTMLIY